MAVRTEKQDFVTTVIIDRIDARNAVDPATADLLMEAFVDFDADPNARVAVFWGAGGAFCAGYDLKYAATLASPEKFKPELAGRLAFPDHGAVSRGPMGPSRLALSKPVIAAVEGAAVAGGMELALWCDMRVMADDAFFGVYCRRWGIPLIDGGTVRLPRLVGMGRAMDIILTGRKVTAEEALRIGLCERVVPRGRPARRPKTWPAKSRGFHRRRCAPIAAAPMRVSALAPRRRWNVNGRAASMRSCRRGRRGAARFAQGRGRQGDFKDI